ncbi:FAD-dependent monooxygenase [Amycolatopsis sp. cg5]|uniref:FAD-dependent monooxygenase n=1 Tax=Amycolatopsis sp. cg5 TaxID=3238802 RepID=UPI0035252EE4
MRVLIAGGGPTGLTLAIDLARRGVDVRVVDQAAAHLAGSRGDGIQPRTLEVFEDLGVLDAVLSAGANQSEMRAYANGELVAVRRMSELKEPTPDLPYPNPWVLAQNDTEAILRARLAEFGVRVELNTGVIGFSQDASGVDVSLPGETVRVDYLVGADGGRSFVRKTLGIAFEGTTDESIRMLLGDVKVDGLDHDYGYWFSTGAMHDGIALTPLPGGDYFQFGAPLDEPTPSLERLQALLDKHSGRSLRMHDLAWSTIWRPNIRLAERFRVGRIFLAGDAAHVHPPTGGQGLNTGVQDAYNLGWKLADGAPELLDSYEAERRAVASEVLGLSTGLLQKHVDGEADAFKRDESTHQLGIGYRGGPLASDSRPAPGPLTSGDRAPDAPLTDANGKPVRLFDLFRGPEWADLVISPDRVLVRAEEFTDFGGHALAAYGTGRFRIRPDGYVGPITTA